MIGNAVPPAERTRIRKSEQEYRNYVNQIALEDVRLIAASVKTPDNGLALSCVKGKIAVTVKDKFWYQNQENRSNIFHQYTATINEQSSGRILAEILCEFAVIYSSRIPMADSFFDIFCKYSLPLTTWPYMREFVHNMTSRMGCPLIAPVLRSFTRREP